MSKVEKFVFEPDSRVACTRCFGGHRHRHRKPTAGGIRIILMEFMEVAVE